MTTKLLTDHKTLRDEATRLRDQKQTIYSAYMVKRAEVDDAEDRLGNAMKADAADQINRVITFRGEPRKIVGVFHYHTDRSDQRFDVLGAVTVHRIKAGWSKKLTNSYGIVFNFETREWVYVDDLVGPEDDQ